MAGEKTVKKALAELVTPERSATVLVELGVMTDIGSRLAWACYKLEGDGPLALYTYEIWGLVLNYLRYIRILFHRMHVYDS
jgi:hypothetical protein